jgi:hypothetical protein
MGVFSSGGDWPLRAGVLASAAGVVAAACDGGCVHIENNVLGPRFAAA